MHKKELYKIFKKKCKKYKKKFKLIKTYDFINDSKYILFCDFMNELFFDSKCSEYLNGNFISIYNKFTDNYNYFIQRINSFEIEEENFQKIISNLMENHSTNSNNLESYLLYYRNYSIDFSNITIYYVIDQYLKYKKNKNHHHCIKSLNAWNVYINKFRYDLTYLINNNIIIKNGDIIELKFESIY